MTGTRRPSRRRLGITAVAVWAALSCGTGWAGAEDGTENTGALPVPSPETVRAFDRASDDGSTTVLEWAAPDKAIEGMAYVVEIAPSQEDFAAGNFKTQTVKPSPAALKAEHLKYFSPTKANKKLYFAEIVPAEHFKPPDVLPLTAERLEHYVEAGLLTEKESARAAQALADSEVDATWLARLRDHLNKKDKEALKDEIARVNGRTFYYRLAVTDGQRREYVTQDGQPLIVSAAGRANLFKIFKLNNLIFALIFSGIVLVFIQMARRNPNLFIRKIAGLEAVEEAIGRATEMGRSVYFVHGLGAVSGLSTIAALNILARVARRAAEYDTRVKVMNYDPIVTAVSQEVVQQAYTEAGRPDAYDPDDVSLVAYDQFSYVAAVGGMMVREQPAAIFLIGYFYAESLLLAETGASTGAIQVAGTDAYTQLPFFVTTCDYTLIGEELFAASAYLSREPRMLGSLRGQDVGKAFLMVMMIVGVAIMTASQSFDWSIEWLRAFLRAF